MEKEELDVWLEKDIHVHSIKIGAKTISMVYLISLTTLPLISMLKYAKIIIFTGGWGWVARLRENNANLSAAAIYC